MNSRSIVLPNWLVHERAHFKDEQQTTAIARKEENSRGFGREKCEGRMEVMVFHKVKVCVLRRNLNKMSEVGNGKW